MKTNNKKSEKKAPEWIEDTFAVSHVYNYSDTLTFFTLHVSSKLGGVAIKNCKVITGSKGDFVSLPSSKGSDDRYYPDVFIGIGEEWQKKIIDEVAKQI